MATASNAACSYAISPPPHLWPEAAAAHHTGRAAGARAAKWTVGACPSACQRDGRGMEYCLVGARDAASAGRSSVAHPKPGRRGRGAGYCGRRAMGGRFGSTGVQPLPVVTRGDGSQAEAGSPGSGRKGPEGLCARLRRSGARHPRPGAGHGRGDFRTADTSPASARR